MKKWRLLLSIAITVIIVFPSCSENDDASNEPNSILGTWQPIKYVEACSPRNEKYLN